MNWLMPVVWAWYPGEQGGNAIADVLFGDYSPSGKLPITIYDSTSQLGDFEDYNISEGGWTYRYFEDEPLYPFGFGLSYNTLEYALDGQAQLKMKGNAEVNVNIKVMNHGEYDQDETLQLYVSKKDAGFKTPLYALKGVKKLHIKAGEATETTFIINKKMLEQIDEEGQKVLPKGNYDIYIGNSSPTGKAVKLGAVKPLHLTLTVK